MTKPQDSLLRRHALGSFHVHGGLSPGVTVRAPCVLLTVQMRGWRPWLPRPRTDRAGATLPSLRAHHHQASPSRSNDRKRHPSRKALTPAAPPLSLSSPLWKEGVPGAENCLEQQGWGSAGLTRGGDGGGRRGADGDEVLESGVCVLRGCQAAGRKRLGERTVAGKGGQPDPPVLMTQVETGWRVLGG